MEIIYHLLSRCIDCGNKEPSVSTFIKPWFVQNVFYILSFSVFSCVFTNMARQFSSDPLD